MAMCQCANYGKGERFVTNRSPFFETIHLYFVSLFVVL